MTKLKFRVPFEEPAPNPGQLLERAWPEGTPEQLAALFADGAVIVDERATRNPERGVDPGWWIEADVPDGEQTFGLPEFEVLARGETWVVVDKAIGVPGVLDRDDPMNSVLFLADMLGFDRDTFTPVWEMPTNVGGPWLLGLTEESALTLKTNIANGRIMSMWSVLCEMPAIPMGQFNHRDITVDYGVSRLQEGLAEIQLTPQFKKDSPVVDVLEFLLSAMETQQTPVVSDPYRGGYMAPGGVRLRLTALFDDGDESSDRLAHSWNIPDDFWPTQPTVPPPPTPEIDFVTEANFNDSVASLFVSRKTLEVLETQGHPWVLNDSDTGSRELLDPGQLVRLQSRERRLGPFALIDSKEGDLVARVWSVEDDSADFFRDEVEIRFDEAVALRSELQRGLAHTDAFRLVHAEGDRLPGFYLDRYGSLLRATLAGGASLGFRHLIYESIADFDPGMTIIEVAHLEDVRARGGELPKARLIREGAGYLKPGQRVIAKEHDLRYWCEPWEGIDVGLFTDQRDNRARLLSQDRTGQRWLNLFCHTGAFSVALIARGAEVVSNDLSKRYLDWLTENLELNDLDTRMNTNVATDARDYLKGESMPFDGIIIDPPTAARSDSGFWSVRKDYQALLASCFGLLKPGGEMLVCRNDKRSTVELETVVQGASKDAKRTIATVENAPPGLDYPRLKGFREGDSFEGLWVTVEA